MGIYDQVVQDYKAGIKVLREMDQDDYHWFLECVPPARQNSTGYVSGEPYTHNAEGKAVYLCCLTLGNCFYAAALGTAAEWDRYQIQTLPVVYKEAA